jgi:hypothetical protein
MSIGVASEITAMFPYDGLVLGFTMAEIMILILFAILMALASSLLSKEKRIRDLVGTTTPTMIDASKLYEEFIKIFPNAHTIDEQFKELRLAVQNSRELDVVKDELQKLKAELESYKEIKEIFETSSDTNINRDELIKNAALGKELIDFANSQKPKIEIKDIKSVLDAVIKSDEEIKQKRELERQLDTMKGQLINLTERLGGRGTEYPPCWVSSAGKIEYIFDIALNSNGYVIRDRKLPNRKNDQALLPIQQIIFDSPILSASFTKQTDPLLVWSKEHNCRFFVRIYDQTGQQEKDIYKHQERVLQQTFYSYEVLNERF